jgi:hypothetical protein
MKENKTQMKILFLCGSLENGKDGVGDYTRRLAGEIIRQGHSAAIVALNDRHISVIEQTEQKSDSTAISVLRLPSILSNKEKYGRVEEYINDFNPEWLSLQFVPYSFNKKGLPFGLARQLKRIGKGRKWHIMFHELWVGMEIKDTFLLKRTGELQRVLIDNLIKILQPKKIHTNTQFYKYQLQNLNIQVNKLPLFGNIPVKYQKLEQEKLSVIFIVFGSIHYGADLVAFIKWLSYIQTEKRVIIHFIGKNGNELTVWEKYLKENNIEYKIFGEQDELNISKLISQADIGIATTPYLLIEKSGSAVAMQEHGLPVMCVSREWTPRNINITFTHDIHKWVPSLELNDILRQKIKGNNLQKITKQFINNIIN